MTRKVYITVQDRNPYGEQLDETLLNDPGKDSTYIEGYSDVRRARELAAARGEAVEPLKHRLQWVRAKSMDGTRADGRQVMHFQSRMNYATLPYDDAVKQGLRVDRNPAILRGADGLCYLGEQVLMVATARTAATNLKKAQQDLEAQMAAPQQRLESAVDHFNRNNPRGKAQAFSFVGDNDPDKAGKGSKK